MPRIKSAQKRARQTVRRTAQNQHTKRLIRLTGLRLKRAVTAADEEAVATLRAELDSRLDRAAKKNLLHPRKVGRKKSQAARLARPVTARSIARHQSSRPATASARTATKKSAPAKPSSTKRTATTARRPAKTAQATRAKKT